MTDIHVVTTRRFALTSEKHLADNDFLSFWGESEASKHWVDIENRQCVVILGEGKCGKTHEFKRQHQLLKADRQFSFFVALELLQDHDFLDVISSEEERDFERWLGCSSDSAVFFLDAVDELKLRQGTLRKALRKIKQAIGSALSRSKFYISCRPSDWNEELDYDALSTLVAQNGYHENEIENVDGAKVFTSIIARDRSYECKKTNNDKQSNNSIEILTLLPFNRRETLEFAKSYSPNHVEEFERHLEKNELWHLYRLPYEIISALNQLSIKGQLGNLEEQLLFGITQKVRENSNKKRNSLSEEKALEGSERLALALFLMKRRSIHSDISQSNVDVINIGEILTDWTYEERLELLGKPLFDPTGVNAYRFHHRATQEYLASQRLKKLREQGLNTGDLFGLLFADVKEEKVVIPSMEPVTAWMALWYPDIYAEVKIRAPSLMFRQGLPAMLPFEYREELIRKYVEKFASSNTWRGVGVGHSDLKRVSTPDLATVVRELWQQAYVGYDTRELLLELIYLTPMYACIDLAFEALFDDKLPSHHRTYAAWAVLEFGNREQKEKVGKAVIQGKWPERLVRSILSHLLPEAITDVEFLNLAKTLKEIPNNVHGLGYELFQGVKSRQLSDIQRVNLRDSLAQAIWNNRKEQCRVYEAHSKFDHFVDAITYCCLKTVPQESSCMHQWAWCVAIAFHFGERRSSIIAKAETKKLRQLLSAQVLLREAYYWACLSIVEELEDRNNFINSDYLIDYDNVLHPFSDEDLPWLIKAFNCGDSKIKKDAAFCKLIQFIRGGEKPQLVALMQDIACDNEEYLNVIERVLHPPLSQPSEYEIENQKLTKKYKEDEAKRINDWQSWREEVLNSECFLLNDQDSENTLYNLFIMLQQSDDSGTWGAWDSGLIKNIFSMDFLEALVPKMAEFWLKADISLYSERNEESKNTFSHNSLMALTAVKCCSEKPNWADRLTQNEAIKAARISTIELNGFASFLTKLVKSHPTAVEMVFEHEIQAQIDNFEQEEKAPIFHDVLYSKFQLVKACAVSAIINKIDTIGRVMAKGLDGDLKYAFELVALHGLDTSKESLVMLIGSYIDNPMLTIDERNSWIAMLTLFDLEEACKKVMQFTSDVSNDDERKGAIALFAAVFGDRHREKLPTFEDIEPIRRLSILHRLVIRSYQVVTPNEDNVREGGGTFRPNTRDRAEQARSYLLENLSRIHVVGTISALYELSTRGEFSHMSSRLKQMAVELAARISEPHAMTLAAFNQFDNKISYLAYDDSSLFKIVNNRLDDFEYHLLNDEQSIVDTLRKVEGETELRRFISFWLNQNSRGAYFITQEAVVASEKRTDIRLHPSGMDKYASLELKLDDSRNKWSGSALKAALVDQLVGRYLNDERCYVGCLLIAMRKPRQWEHPETNEKMNLQETVSWLQGVANKIMDDRPELYISIKGIDYSKIANERCY
ncbi:TPA: hypothetical protein ACPHT2_003855 [Vibrio antiquarius]